MSFLGSLRTWLLFNNKIIPQKYNDARKIIALSVIAHVCV